MPLTKKIIVIKVLKNDMLYNEIATNIVMARSVKLDKSMLMVRDKIKN